MLQRLRPYHPGAETPPLVACETENLLQIGGACLQVIAYHTIPPYPSDDCQLVMDVGRRHLRSFLHVCRPANTVTDWQQEFLCSRTAAMGQPTDIDPEERHYVRTL